MASVWDPKNTVVWSGGADSTLVLTQVASHATAHHPVVALSVDAHPQLDVVHMKHQRAARARYMKWAKARGHHIHYVSIEMTEVGVGPLNLTGGQPMLWLAHLAPYFVKGDVSFGYVRRDDFWHQRRQFEDAFVALLTLAGLSCEMKLPLEWDDKASVLTSLAEWKVPDSCWWTCDGVPKGRRPCGTCGKCKELLDARAEIAGRVKMTDKVVMKKVKR